MFTQVKHVMLASLNKSCRNMQMKKDSSIMPYACQLDCRAVVYDSSGSLKDSWKVSATSPGFSEEQALTLASDKLLFSELLPRLTALMQTQNN